MDSHKLDLYFIQFKRGSWKTVNKALSNEYNLKIAPKCQKQHWKYKILQICKKPQNKIHNWSPWCIKQIYSPLCYFYLYTIICSKCYKIQILLIIMEIILQLFGFKSLKSWFNCIQSAFTFTKINTVEVEPLNFILFALKD